MKIVQILNFQTTFMSTLFYPREAQQKTQSIRKNNSLPCTSVCSRHQWTSRESLQANLHRNHSDTYWQSTQSRSLVEILELGLLVREIDLVSLVDMPGSISSVHEHVCVMPDLLLSSGVSGFHYDICVIHVCHMCVCDICG